MNALEVLNNPFDETIECSIYNKSEIDFVIKYLENLIRERCNHCGYRDTCIKSSNKIVSCEEFNTDYYPVKIKYEEI